MFSTCLNLLTGQFCASTRMVTFTTVNDQSLKNVLLGWTAAVNESQDHAVLWSQTNPAPSPTDFGRSGDDDRQLSRQEICAGHFKTNEILQ